ncbi:LytTR family transcriptional regulator [Epibacterium sp. SM1979]|uniref:LytTR family transcriptional regulator n=1 Tax=Tritonibacter litoralis TaxID=2662264 RepID=A0A843YGQ6_9RHOB|nr:LytTR family DNA-binding domain-containing protein [Tritonibacter litoralis]MQQ08472.1 LytTR family transcriptional regulator [Tritonibacter litoralis]
MPLEFKLSNLMTFLGGETVSRRHRLLVGAILLLACATVLAGLEPGATRELSFLWAVIHWIAHLLGAVLILALLTILAMRLGLPDLWAMGAAVLLLPLCLAPLSLGMEAVIANATGGTDLDPDGYWEELSHVALPAIGLTTLAVLAVFKAAEFAMAHRAPLMARFDKEPTLRSLFADLPHTLGEDLISVSANDHYVHLRTVEGSTMLNLKFTDCVEKLSPLKGVQVHRSHWVRLKHIDQVRPNGSSYLCIMRDGSEISVSRRRYAGLKQALERHAAG